MPKGAARGREITVRCDEEFYGVVVGLSREWNLSMNGVVQRCVTERNCLRGAPGSTASPMDVHAVAAIVEAVVRGTRG